MLVFTWRAVEEAALFASTVHTHRESSKSGCCCGEVAPTSSAYPAEPPLPTAGSGLRAGVGVFKDALWTFPTSHISVCSHDNDAGNAAFPFAVPVRHRLLLKITFCAMFFL